MPRWASTIKAAVRQYQREAGRGPRSEPGLEEAEIRALRPGAGRFATRELDARHAQVEELGAGGESISRAFRDSLTRGPYGG